MSTAGLTRTEAARLRALSLVLNGDRHGNYTPLSTELRLSVTEEVVRLQSKVTNALLEPSWRDTVVLWWDRARDNRLLMCAMFCLAAAALCFEN